MRIRDYNEAIITQGGVAVKEINPATMESKKTEGLYFAGEVLDLDAFDECGYNLSDCLVYRICCRDGSRKSYR